MTKKEIKLGDPILSASTLAKLPAEQLPYTIVEDGAYVEKRVIQVKDSKTNKMVDSIVHVFKTPTDEEVKIFGAGQLNSKLGQQLGLSKEAMNEAKETKLKDSPLFDVYYDGKIGGFHQFRVLA